MPLRGDKNASVFRDLDWITVLIYVIMVFAGMVSIYAACYDFDGASMFSADEFSGKQLRWIALGSILALVLLLIESRMYETYAYPLYVLMVIVLALTPFLATDTKGSYSWIDLGFMSVQPAEFAKCTTALALAKLFSSYHFELNAKPMNYVKALTIIFLPVVLILLQNETGSALVYMSLFFVLYREGMSGLVLFGAVFAVLIFVVGLKYTDSVVAGMPTGQFAVCVIIMLVCVGMTAVYARRLEVARNLLLGFLGAGLLAFIVDLCGVEVPGTALMVGLIVAGCVYIVFEAIKTHRPRLYGGVAAALFGVVFLFCVGAAFNYLQPHQQMRIKVALGMVEDLRDAGYNVNQSKIAIGSGGIAGKGFLNGTQTKLKYVPEQHTDFIFCTIGEEEGFLGSAAVTLLFLALILRILKIGERQPTTFGRVYAYCVASYFIFHFCINIGMVIGLCPVIGIPLPFFSYGGSSLWGFTILLFILLKIDASRRNVMVY